MMSEVNLTFCLWTDNCINSIIYSVPCWFAKDSGTLVLGMIEGKIKGSSRGWDGYITLSTHGVTKSCDWT